MPMREERCMVKSKKWQFTNTIYKIIMLLLKTQDSLHLHFDLLKPTLRNCLIFISETVS